MSGNHTKPSPASQTRLNMTNYVHHHIIHCYVTTTSPLRHFNFNATSPLRHRYVTATSLLLHCYVTAATVVSRAPSDVLCHFRHITASPKTLITRVFELGNSDSARVNTSASQHVRESTRAPCLRSCDEEAERVKCFRA